MKHELQVERSKRLHEESLTQRDAIDGIYLPASRIAAEEGGDAQAQQAACRYVSEAIRRHQRGLSMNGRPWVSWNSWTARAEFLYIKKRYSEDHTNKWMTTKEEAERVARPAERATEREKPTLKASAEKPKADKKNEKPKGDKVPKGPK